MSTLEKLHPDVRIEIERLKTVARRSEQNAEEYAASADKAIAAIDRTVTYYAKNAMTELIGIGPELARAIIEHIKRGNVPGVRFGGFDDPDH